MKLLTGPNPKMKIPLKLEATKEELQVLSETKISKIYRKRVFHVVDSDFFRIKVFKKD